LVGLQADVLAGLDLQNALGSQVLALRLEEQVEVDGRNAPVDDLELFAARFADLQRAHVKHLSS